MQRVITRITVMGALLVLCVGGVARGDAGDPHPLNGNVMELMKQGEYDKGLEQLRNAFSLNAYDAGLKRNLADAYAYVGRKLLDRNRYDEAVRYFDSALELFPDDPRFATLRGIDLYLAKRYDEAAIDLERARQNGGETVEALFFLGKVRYDTGNLDGALEAWDKALTLDPANAAVKELIEKARREATVEGKMDKGYSSRFTITYDADVKSDLADSILDALETAYNRVGADFDHFPTAKIPVILYTRKDYRTVTAGPDWSGGLYDGKIRLPIGGAKELAPMLRAVLAHEYTHVVVRELTHGNCPTWLNEGVAEVEGRKELDLPLMVLPKAVKNGTILPFSALEGSVTGLSGSQAHLAYEQSYSIARFMIAAYGWHKVREIMVSLGSGKPVAAAVAKGLGDYGIDYARLEQEWREYVQRELGR
jgi:tetratricopeptide (TPR) repeat protein